MEKRVLIYCVLLFPFFGIAQTVADSLQIRTAVIGYDVMGNEVQFSPQTPPLNQMAGAPKAYYSYYWEFGDGRYSTEKEPKHSYKEKGEYEARLWVTNHYDNGKPPATRPEKVSVSDVTDDYQEEASMENTLDIKRNRDPVPGEEIVLVMRYKNPKAYETRGKLYLFFNERKYKTDHFQISDIRTYHGEKQLVEPLAVQFQKTDDGSDYASLETFNQRKILKDSTERVNLPATLEESQEEYKNYEAFSFDKMQPNEQRNIFFTVQATPEMLKDTSAIVKVRSIYVPDDDYPNHNVKETEMEVVTSHDPNKMASNATIMNYRLVRFKKFLFKIKFQNNGEGPASTIKLDTDIPEMFNPKTIEVVDQYPECPICPDEREVQYSCLDTTFAENKAVFTFKNIYLPGSEQKNVKEYDSTKGFVKYRIALNKDFHKTKTKSRTAIYFDKNEPIITNYATTRFKPGLSIGAKAGFHYTFETEEQEYFAGVTVSPFKSYRGYWQAELMVGAGSFDELSTFSESEVVNEAFTNTYEFTQSKEIRNISAYLVPISYRYNLNNYLAVAGGAQLKVDLSETTETNTTGEYFLEIPNENVVIRDETQDISMELKKDCSFVNFQPGVFVGANAGFVRIGPSIGARYIYYFNEPHQQLQLYAIWKF
ncbi:PKD domain-containing protein [Luteirhabdus pelagi]|uniref:PKD domain-containing protein n=1 Tax=Luteirhabdus pelagi TaxID=2792783 RepID=UPI0019393E11|nr:PKD domain-containing protein [Luteirhabdus pelagi]